MIYNSPYKYWPDENDPKQIIKYQYNCYFNGKDIFFRIENSGFVKSCDDHDVLRLIFSGIGWLRPIQCCCLHGLFWNGRLWCIWAFPLISDSHHRDEPMKPGINKTGFLKVLYKFVSKSKVKEVSIISPGLKCFCGHLYEYSTINLAKGAFNNYVDKMRGGGGPKMSAFVHAQGIKTIHAEGVGQKMAKFCPRTCWMTPWSKLQF